MKRNLIETALGVVVIAIAIGFFVYSYEEADIGEVIGYELTASFADTGGLSNGDDVRVSGVKVGTIKDIELDTETYLANVIMQVEKDVLLPLDTGALISSESLLGGRFLLLQPGADENYLEDGDEVEFTQAPQNLEQLLGKFIFSVQDSKSNSSSNMASSPVMP